MLLGNDFFYFCHCKPVSIPFKWCHICMEHAFVSSRVEYAGCTHEKFAKSSDNAQQLFFEVDSCLVDWMIDVCRNKTYWQLATISSFNKQERQSYMEEPHTAITAWHILMLLNSLVTHCCGMASHSSTYICCLVT